jgi:hypothetical protein
MNSARIKTRAKARRAYWLGGGGVNEPTPGTPKYKKEDAESIREEDKQMVGEPMETGSEGLHPGDLEVKKKVLRAQELEARKLRRRAYFLGGGGVNEPTPGKTKYPKEDAESIRDEDKHMTGTKEMGIDGMAPGDKEIKEKVLRAKLKAKFTKTAGKKDSKWDFFADDQLILSASGDEIYGDELNENWDYLSSAQYGKDVMAHIRNEGLDKVAYLLKGADAAAPAMPEMPAMPPMPAPEAAPAAPAPATGPAPAGTEAAPTPEAPKADDVSEKVNAALSAIEEKISEVRDLMAGKTSGLAEVEVGTEAPMDAVLASVESLLDEAADEMALISEAFESGRGIEKAAKLAAEALADSKAIVAEADAVLAQFKKTATPDLKARAAKRAALLAKFAKFDDEEIAEHFEEETGPGHFEAVEEDFTPELDAEEELGTEKPKIHHEFDAKDKKEDKKDELKALKDEIKELKDKLKDCKCGEEKEEEEEEEEEMCAHDKKMEQCADCKIDGKPLPAGAKLEIKASKRDQLIAKAEAILGKYTLDLGKAENCTEPTFSQAHPKGGTTTELTGTKTPEAKVETIEEAHKIMREVAESGPRNVREAAAELQEKVVEGKIKVADLDQLVSEGKADAEAVAYFKKYFAQASGAGSFGADLSKEFAASKKTASDDNYKIKLRRAYDVGLMAQDKGFISTTKEALDSYVDEIMKFDDAAFESTKRVMAQYGAKVKTAGVLPVVGSESARVDLSASTEPKTVSVAEQLSVLWKK